MKVDSQNINNLKWLTRNISDAIDKLEYLSDDETICYNNIEKIIESSNDLLEISNTLKINNRLTKEK